MRIQDNRPLQCGNCESLDIRFDFQEIGDCVLKSVVCAKCRHSKVIDIERKETKKPLPPAIYTQNKYRRF